MDEKVLIGRGRANSQVVRCTHCQQTFLIERHRPQLEWIGKALALGAFLASLYTIYLFFQM